MEPHRAAAVRAVWPGAIGEASVGKSAGMNPELTMLMALLTCSLMFSVIFFVAWREMDRPRHALLWALAFALGATQWIVSVIGVTFFPTSIVFFLLSSAAPLMQINLSLAAYRHRSGLPERWPIMTATMLGALILTVITMTITPHQGIRYSIIPVYTVVALILCIRAILLSPHRVTMAEKTTIGALALFAVFELAQTGTALARGVVGDAEDIARYRMLLLMGLPSFYIGSGLFSVFLLATDQAERMRLLAASDPLTGILNRRGFEEGATRALFHARRAGKPLTLALADLDHFKTINDRFGHAAGDVVLRQFVEVVQASLRREDLCGRMGGEEFAILLTDTSGRAAYRAIERLREQIEGLRIEGDPAFRITSSFGMTELAAGDVAIDPLLARADDALYRSKTAGRNRVTLIEPVESPPD